MSDNENHKRYWYALDMFVKNGGTKAEWHALGRDGRKGWMLAAELELMKKEHKS